MTEWIENRPKRSIMTNFGEFNCLQVFCSPIFQWHLGIFQFWVNTVGSYCNVKKSVRKKTFVKSNIHKGASLPYVQLWNMEKLLCDIILCWSQVWPSSGPHNHIANVPILMYIQCILLWISGSETLHFLCITQVNIRRQAKLAVV